MRRSDCRPGNCGSGERRDRACRPDSQRHSNRASRRRRRADRRAVLSHRRGVDAVRGRARSRTADAARSCDPVARRAAGEPAHPRSPVHGRPRRWFSRSDRDEPDAALTLLAGPPALPFTGMIGAALAVTLHRGGLLLAVLVLPLSIPVLNFDVATSEAAITEPLSFGAPFSILCALSLVSFVVGPFAAAAS